MQRYRRPGESVGGVCVERKRGRWPKRNAGASAVLASPSHPHPTLNRATAAGAEDDFDADEDAPAAPPPPPPAVLPLPLAPLPITTTLPPAARRNLPWSAQAAAATDAGVALPLLAQRGGVALLRQSELFVPIGATAPARRPGGAARARARAQRVAAAAAAAGGEDDDSAAADEAAALVSAVALDEGGGDGDGDAAAPPLDDGAAAATTTTAAPAAPDAPFDDDDDDEDLPALVAGEPADEPWPAPPPPPRAPPPPRSAPPPSAPPAASADAGAGLPPALFAAATLVEWEDDVDWQGGGQSGGSEGTTTRAPPDDALSPLPSTSVRPPATTTIHPLALRFDAGPPTAPPPPSATTHPRAARGGWTEEIDWGGVGAPPRPPTTLHLDANDPSLLLEVTTDKPPASLTSLAAKAAAAIVAPPPGAAGPPIPHSLPPAAAALARLNVSTDAAYAPKVARAARAAAGGPRHAAPAATLATLPLKRAPRATRVRGAWVSPPLKATAAAPAAPGTPAPTTATVRLASTVGGCGRDAVAQRFPAVPLASTTGDALWETASSASTGGKFAGVGAAAPYVLWRRGPGGVARVDASATLATALAGALPPPPADGAPPTLELALTFPTVDPLPTETAAALPPPASGAPTRPPGAYTKKKDVTARGPGHVLLIEHMEEYPAAQGAPGMGARVTTYYRRRAPTDGGASRVGRGEPKWRVGTVEPLARDAPSPFLLGWVAPGDTQLAVDTGLARAPAAPHTPRASDFLLIRRADGALAVRELTGTLLLGQHEPHVRVPAPGSRLQREIEEARALAHAARELRRRAARVDAGRARGPASITVAELADAFPGVPRQLLRERLRSRLDCVPVRADAEDAAWALRPGGALPVEGELRKLAPPEAWCLHDAGRAGVARQRAAGVRFGDRLAGLPPERLRVAAQSLPPGPGVAAAAAVVEHAAATAPWTTTDAFVGVEREGGRGALALTGVADPTGRGRGFAYARDARRAVVELPPGTSRRDAGSISGTGRDLRRLSMQQAKDILVSLGVTPTEVDSLARWSRIGLIRELSSAAAVDGGELADRYGARYARVNRVGAAELAEQRRRVAATIWERQLRALTSEVALKDDPPPRDPVTGWADTKKKKGKGGGGGDAAHPDATTTNTDATDAAALADLVREGFLQAGGEGGVADAAAAAKPRLDAAPGDRRVRRTVRWTRPDGSRGESVIVFSDKDAVAALNATYARTGAPEAGSGAGFGRRTVRGRPGRATDAAGPSDRATTVCTACGGLGHTRKNRACPRYGETDGPPPPPPRAKKAKTSSMPPPPPPPPLPSAPSSGGLKLRISAGGRQLAVVQGAPAEASAAAGGGSKRRRPSPIYLDDDDYVSEEDAGARDSGDDDSPRKRKRARKSGGGGGGRARAAAAPPQYVSPPPPTYAPPPPPLPPAVPTPAAARRLLCSRGLAPALAAAKRALPPTTLDPFRRAVPKAAAPDYADVVPASMTMDVDRMERNLKNGRYGSLEALLVDADKIVAAARAYNEVDPATGAPRGKYGGPTIIPLAEAVRDAIVTAVRGAAAKIERLEAGVAEAEAARAAVGGG